jgi:prepilin peptidase CpaA
MDMNTFATAFAATWPIWLVTVVLVVAAVIDGIQLKVPNWLTYPFVITGWVYSVSAYGLEGLGWTVLGTIVGLVLLLPAYSIGGMGAGDVKLMMGIGAWVHVSTTFYAFCATTIVGAVLAVLMVLARKAWQKHYMQFWSILAEIMVIKNPDKLATIAAERKSTMLLLPYGIPMAIGTIGYFAWMGMYL